MIDWTDPDYVAAGHFYTLIQSVAINCSDPAGSVPAGAESYAYGANTTADGGGGGGGGGELEVPSVQVTNRTTVMNGALPERGAGIAAWRLGVGVVLVLGGSVFLSWA